MITDLCFLDKSGHETDGILHKYATATEIFGI